MMMTEQEKIDLFYRKLKGDKINKPYTRVGLMIWVFVLVMLCAFPVQNHFVDDGNTVLISLWIGVLSGIGGFLYVYPYEFYEENMKSRLIEEEIIKYHPIHIRTLKKMLIKKEMSFYLKLTVVCMLSQIASSYIVYGTVEWSNLIYILLVVFIVPVLFEVIPRIVRLKIFYTK